MDEISIKVGDRVRQIRQLKGISQEELADNAGINRSFVGQIERGQRNATVKTIEKICVALDTTLYDFFSFDRIELNPEDETLKRISSMLKHFDENQTSQLLDIMKKISDFKS